MNFLTLGQAIATRWSTVTPPTGLRALTGSSATPPNSMSNTPFMVTWPISGDLVLQGQRLESRDGTPTIYHSELYYAKNEGDQTRESRALALWLGTLIAHWFSAGSLSLGLSASLGVAKVLPISWEILPLTYAGSQFDGIRIELQVWWGETVIGTP